MIRSAPAAKARRLSLRSAADGDRKSRSLRPAVGQQRPWRGRCSTFQTGRPAAAIASTGSSPESWIASGSIGGDDRRQLGRRSVGGDCHDRRGRRSAGEASRISVARYAASASGQAARRARHEVEADGVGAGTDRGQGAVRVGDAADLDQRLPRFRGHVVWHGTGGDEGTGRRGRVGRAHQRLADEGSVKPDRPPADQRPGLAHARFAHHQPVVGHQRPQSHALLRIDLESAQVAVVEPDQPGAGRQRGFEFALVVGLDQRLEAEFAGEAGEPGQLPGRQDGGQEQDHVGARGAQQRQLALVDDELFGEDRERHRGSDDAEVRDGAAEPVRLAQDGDRARAAGLVGAGQRDRVGLARRWPRPKASGA